MWSLPDISALNARAEADYKKKASKSLRGKKCSCGEKATHAEEIYDIFGKKDIPKSIEYLCEGDHCQACFDESVFWCSGCERYQVLNYTWELYNTVVNDEQLCLRCAFEHALESDDPDENPWVYQEDVDRLEKWLKAGEVSKAFDWVRHKVKHLIAVESTYWEDHLIFQANVTLDHASGGAVRGFSACDSGPEAGLREILDHLKKVLVNTNVRDFLVNLGAPAPEPARCALILDGAYQFSVSIGIYFERKFSGAKAKEVRHAAAAR
jgi:hypothetical protein